MQDTQLQQYISENDTRLQEWIFLGNCALIGMKQDEKETVIHSIATHCVQDLCRTNQSQKFKPTLLESLKVGFKTHNEKKFIEYLKNHIVKTAQRKFQSSTHYINYLHKIIKQFKRNNFKINALDVYQPMLNHDRTTYDEWQEIFEYAQKHDREKRVMRENSEKFAEKGITYALSALLIGGLVALVIILYTGKSFAEVLAKLIGASERSITIPLALITLGSMYMGVKKLTEQDVIRRSLSFAEPPNDIFLLLHNDFKLKLVDCDEKQRAIQIVSKDHAGPARPSLSTRTKKISIFSSESSSEYQSTPTQIIKKIPDKNITLTYEKSLEKEEIPHAHIPFVKKAFKETANIEHPKDGTPIKFTFSNPLISDYCLFGAIEKDNAGNDIYHFNKYAPQKSVR